MTTVAKLMEALQALQERHGDLKVVLSGDCNRDTLGALVVSREGHLVLIPEGEDHHLRPDDAEVVRLEATGRSER